MYVYVHVCMYTYVCVCVYIYIYIYTHIYICLVDFQGGASGKEPVCKAGDIRDSGLNPSREDPLEEGIVAHSSILVWRIPWTEENGGLQSIGSQKVRHGWSDLAHTHVYLYIYHIYI